MGTRNFLLDGTTVASLSRDGRIFMPGEAGPALPQLGYAAPLPSARLLDALGALLARELSDRLGGTVITASTVSGR